MKTLSGKVPINRTDPIIPRPKTGNGYGSEWHKGEDCAASVGTGVPVCENGQVIAVGPSSVTMARYDANGNIVGYSRYLHVTPDVQVGDYAPILAWQYKYRKCTWFLGFFLTFFFITLLNVNIIFAKEPYTNKSEIVCNDVRVQIQTECFSGNDLPYNGHYPYCISQKIIFTDKMGKIVSKNISGRLVNDISPDKNVLGQSLDALAFEYACVKGNSDSYLLIGYYNGGNCEACEWHEIYTLRGEKLASNRHGEGFRGGKYKHFKDMYKRLGLQKTWPRSSFVAIDLKKDRKNFK